MIFTPDDCVAAFNDGKFYAVPCTIKKIDSYPGFQRGWESIGYPDETELNTESAITISFYVPSNARKNDLMIMYAKLTYGKKSDIDLIWKKYNLIPYEDLFPLEQ